MKQKLDLEQDTILKKIDKFFRETGISAIFFLRNRGTYSSYRTIEGRDRILNHARIELRANEMINEEAARELSSSTKVQQENNHKIVKYVG